MSHRFNSPTAKAAARLNQAIESIFHDPNQTPPSFARQTLPNHANARQSTPPNQNAQNEPTASPLTPNAAQSTRQSAPNHANAPHHNGRSKTNPPRPLTPNQLRAARLLVAGHRTTAIAGTLQIDRHTLATWKRLPHFQRELSRLVDLPEC